MDDDHEVEPDTLRLLREAIETRHCDLAGPAILSIKRDGGLAWELGIPGQTKYKTYAALEEACRATGVLNKIPDAFNAVLYKRSVFETIGLPDDRLFIRGDEVEFSMRMEKQGTPSTVVVAAKVYHPAAANDKCSVLTVGGRALTAYYTGNRLKDYCIFRNRAFYYKKYGRYKSLLLDPLRYALFFLMTRRLDWAGFGLWVRGYRDGLRGHFGYERQLIAR
jgi:rhamnopyranosyl-N-acetylglucosaminyl-diphospho-decaprenol beta-1,3/1,4-galactofuranosyltransferase